MLHDRRGAAGHRADVRVGVGSADDRALPAARFGAARQNPEPELPRTLHEYDIDAGFDFARRRRHPAARAWGRIQTRWRSAPDWDRCATFAEAPAARRLSIPEP